MIQVTSSVSINIHYISHFIYLFSSRLALNSVSVNIGKWLPRNMWLKLSLLVSVIYDALHLYGAFLPGLPLRQLGPLLITWIIFDHSIDK